MDRFDQPRAVFRVTGLRGSPRTSHDLECWRPITVDVAIAHGTRMFAREPPHGRFRPDMPTAFGRHRPIPASAARPCPNPSPGA